VAPPPPPLPLPINSEPEPADISDSSGANSTDSHLPNSIATFHAGSTEPPAQASCNSTVPEKFAPLLVLKTGVYSVNKYWVKKKILYFETTSGDSLYAPLSLLERIVPTR
jgi:hypothetical protein